MKLELLYFEACPAWKTTLSNLKQVLRDLDREAIIDLIRVETQADAKVRCFVGSPTIRLDGEDLFPTDSTQFALSCRLYPTPDGLRGTLTQSMLREALHATGPQ